MRPLVAAATLLLLAVTLAPAATAGAAATPLGPCQGPVDVQCYDDTWTQCGPPYPECQQRYHFCLLYYVVSARAFCVEGGIIDG